jgi:hypothetical protein
MPASPGLQRADQASREQINQRDQRETMFTGDLKQLSGTDSSGLASQLKGRGNVAPGDDSEAAFALLYTEALGLASDQCAGTSASVDDEVGLLATDDYGGLHAPSKLIPGKADASGDAEGNLENSKPVLDKSQLAHWMDAHALTRSSHHCAMYCRLGMEAAGLSTQDRPRSGDAADYGPFLLRHGAQVLAADSYTPQVGDTVVFDKTAQHPYGHIEMYDGQRWVSDFMQHSFSPYRDAASTPPFTIYRLT